MGMPVPTAMTTDMGITGVVITGMATGHTDITAMAMAIMAAEDITTVVAIMARASRVA